MKHRSLHSLLFVLLTLTLSACVPEATLPSIDSLFGGGAETEVEPERIIYISAETIACGEAQCLLTRTNEEDSWEQLNAAIIGFEYARNTAYTLRVREDIISGTVVLRLVDVLSQSLETPTEEAVAETSAEEASSTTESESGVVEEVNSVNTNDENSEATSDTETTTASDDASTQTETVLQDEASEASETNIVETISERELLLFVDQTLGACSSENDDLCLRVRENRNDPWGNLGGKLTGVIANFDYVPSNYYVLRVLERTISTEKPNEDSGTQTSQIFEYSLVDLISQTPSTQEKLVYIGPEILSCDEVANENCYQYKESRNADYDAKAMDIIGFNHQDGYAYALKLLANLDQNSQIVNYELVEVISRELLADGRFVEKVIYIGPELAPCAYGPSELCYVFRESAEEPFRVLASEITGFRHQTGFDYELKVRQKVSQPDLETSTTALELVEIIYQQAVIEEIEEVAAVEEPAEEETAKEVVEETAETSTEVVETTTPETAEDVTEPEVTSPPTISETIAGAAQAQLENTAAITIEESTGDEPPLFPASTTATDLDRKNVTITVSPPAQAPLAVPTVQATSEVEAAVTTETTLETEGIEAEVIEAVAETETAVQSVQTDSIQIEETTTDVDTTEQTVEVPEATTQEATTEKRVPIQDFGDVEASGERNKIIFIDSSLEECEINSLSQWCYLSKDNLPDDWFLLPFGISNFDYEEGYVYVLRIRELFFGDDPITGSANYSLELIDVLAKTEDKSYEIVQEAERREEQTAALEEAALIAQTFEEEAAVLEVKETEEVVDRTQDNLTEAEAIAADTQAAQELIQKAEAQKLADLAEAEAIAADTEAALATQAEANRKAEEEAADAKKAEEEAIAVAEAKKAEEEAIAAAEAKKAEEEAAEAKKAEELAAAEASEASTTESTSSTMTVNAATPAETPAETSVEIQEATEAAETKTVFIAEQLTSCQPEGMAEQLCYAFKENPEDDWQLLYNEIVNFEFFEGYIYELEVIENVAQNLPTELGRWFEVIEMTNAFPVSTGN